MHFSPPFDSKPQRHNWSRVIYLFQTVNALSLRSNNWFIWSLKLPVLKFLWFSVISDNEELQCIKINIIFFQGILWKSLKSFVLYFFHVNCVPMPCLWIARSITSASLVKECEFYGPVVKDLNFKRNTSSHKCIIWSWLYKRGALIDTLNESHR